MLLSVCRAWHDTHLISSACLILSSLQSDLCVCARDCVQTGRLPPSFAGVLSSQCVCMVVAVLISLLQRCVSGWCVAPSCCGPGACVPGHGLALQQGSGAAFNRLCGVFVHAAATSRSVCCFVWVLCVAPWLGLC